LGILWEEFPAGVCYPDIGDRGAIRIFRPGMCRLSWIAQMCGKNFKTMSSTIQILQKISCRSAPALVFVHIVFCFFCPKYNCRTLFLDKHAANNFQDVLWVFDIELVDILENNIERYRFASHRLLLYHNWCCCKVVVL